MLSLVTVHAAIGFVPRHDKQRTVAVAAVDNLGFAVRESVPRAASFHVVANFQHKRAKYRTSVRLVKALAEVRETA